MLCLSVLFDKGSEIIEATVATVRMPFDRLVEGQVLPVNSVASLKEPTYVVKWAKPLC